MNPLDGLFAAHAARAQVRAEIVKALTGLDLPAEVLALLRADAKATAQLDLALKAYQIPDSAAEVH